MKKTIYILSLIILSFYGCKPKEKLKKNISCEGNVKLQYEWLDWDKEDKHHVVANRFFKGQFTVYFVGGFKDSLKFYVNNDFRADLEVDRKENDEVGNYGFSFGRRTGEPIPTLKIESVNRKTCFDIKLKRKYPIMYVWLNEKREWTIRFSNFNHSDNLKASL
ncbi:hypothetical protein [Flavobacterium suncheonense]|uniref:Lipoprotein n=1 Tax=Flavobacterium suncheonense GH29-5 = DSM 17707 TaxID=1121899 RepID=A0A0A2MBU3_9FLAO|nr:hypothetical protein [Flavobacterium suncheonense]KGO85745.1 hypothetical protein Q764_13930 [Flavobacterium suncheonense GH29-5 = DSM 17707]